MALVVVAHPDDETLWLQPWLAPDAEIVVAFPDHPRDPSVTAGREAVRGEFPLGRMEFLPLHSLDVLGRSDWRRRRPTREGVELRRDCPDELRRRYAENHAALCELLATRIGKGSVVYTHNPWGEYGHEEHIQVCRAVLDVASAARASVWAWDGLSPAELVRSSMRLRADYYGGELHRLPRERRTTDRAVFAELRELYQRHGAWTWLADYQPPDQVDYVELMHDGEQLITAAAPSPAVRTTKILARHLSRSPAVLRRLLTAGRLRAPR
jgi:LmbE family N-acetylglucosaminyl deacetylase